MSSIVLTPPRRVTGDLGRFWQSSIRFFGPLRAGRRQDCRRLGWLKDNAADVHLELGLNLSGEMVDLKVVIHCIVTQHRLHLPTLGKGVGYRT